MSSTVDVAKEYFSTLSEGQIRRLYRRYQTDFELFGYSAEEFLHPKPRATTAKTAPPT